MPGAAAERVPAEVLTPRLRIRHWRRDDLDALTEIFAWPEVWKFPFGRGFSREETEQFLEARIAAQESGGAGPAATEERHSGRLLGYVSLNPPTWLPEVMPTFEIGWRLEPGSWGQGLATEGARALLDFGFELMALPEILSIYEPENVASGRVMANVGLPFLRETVHPYFHRPLHIHGLARRDWEARATAQPDNDPPRRFLS